MKKNLFLIFILLIFIPKANAQFEGYYNLRDGGVDMPHSSLFVLSNNEFIIFYYAGYKIGTWKETVKSTIQLSETKSSINPFIVYAEPNNTENMSIDVYGLAQSNAFVNFSKDTISNKEFQPIFNDYVNCIRGQYSIKKKKQDNNWLTLTVPSINAFDGNTIKYPYKAVSYTFALDAKYGNYRVAYNPEVLRGKLEFTISKNGETYLIFDEKKVDREDLSEELLDKIAKSKTAIDNEMYRKNWGDLVTCVATQNIIIEKPILKPLFTVKCDDEIEESPTEKSSIISKTKILVDRKNGFYTVKNYKEREYDIAKLQLAKEPSITINDILSIKKSISDYGGFVIDITLNKTGSLKFKELTKKNINKPIAIVINKVLVSAPIVSSEIAGGKMQIAGSFTSAEIDELIEQLKQ